MKTVAMMPIKLRNERLPGKNTKLLGGKPLLQYELDSLKATGMADEIYVYCSSENVIQYLPEGVMFLKRPECLDLPAANFTQFFETFMKEKDADIYIVCHATAPFVSEKTMRECIMAVKGGAYDSAFCAREIRAFLWKGGKPLNFDPSNIPQTQSLEPIYEETSGIYVFRKDVFAKYRRRIGDNPYIKRVSVKEAVDIDGPEDFRLAEVLLDANISQDDVSESDCREKGKRSVNEQNNLNVIFDLDGVLIDSLEVQKSAYYGSYNEVVGDGNAPAFSEFLKHSGESLPNIFTKMGLPLRMVEPYRRISSEAVQDISVNEEAFKMIGRLREKGVKCAVCTGKDRRRTMEILSAYGVTEFFDAIVCSDDVNEPKPSAAPVMKAMKMMGGGAGPDNTVVIGDGYYDIQCAHNAGCEAVLALWYGDYGVPREADYVAETVSQLERLLMGMTKRQAATMM